MPVYREPFSQLNRRQLTLLIKKTHLYAVKILGNRQGRSPVLDPEDLVMRALEDTMVGADRTGNGAEPKGRLWVPPRALCGPIFAAASAVTFRIMASRVKVFGGSTSRVNLEPSLMIRILMEKESMSVTF